METLSLNLPALYGDHHVLEIRRILQELPGIEAIYASSAFRLVQVNYDPHQIDADAIKATLDKAGYLQDFLFPTEIGAAPYNASDFVSHFRHTTAYEHTKQVISFAQDVTYSGRPLWPCPGMGVMRRTEEGEDHG